MQVDTGYTLNKMGRFKNIFDWEEWDDMFEIEIFYDCELVSDVGDFKVGTLFDNIQFDKHDLVLYFYENEGDSTPCMVKKFILEF